MKSLLLTFTVTAALLASVAQPAKAQINACPTLSGESVNAAEFGPSAYGVNGDLTVVTDPFNPSVPGNPATADWYLGSGADVDVYGAVTIPSGLMVTLKAGSILNIYGNMVNNGALYVEPGATINFYGETWTNGTGAIVGDGAAVANATPGGSINFLAARPAIPPAYLTAGTCAGYSGGNFAQNIDGGNVPMDIALHIQNANNVVLINTATKIEGSLSWDVANGDVMLGDNDLVFTTNATEAGYQPDRFAVTKGTGHVVKENYTGNWVYPVGIDENNYTPAAINNATANTMHVLVQDYATSASEEKGSSGMDRTWNIYADNATGNSTINLQHNSGTNQAGFNNASHFVTRYSALANNHTGSGDPLSLGPWQSNTLGAGTATGSLTTGAAIAGASERSLAYTDFATSAANPIAYYSKSSSLNNPLPVKLVSFTATAKECTAVLEWETANEVNFDRFEVLYSADAVNFSKVGTLEGKGNTTGSHYSFTYAQPEAKGYYQLQMIDVNGSATFSKTLSVTTNCGSVRPIALWPNPTNGIVQVSGLQVGEQLQLYAVNGQVIIHRTVVSERETLDLSSYANGLYQLIILNAGERLEAIKIIKQ